MADHKVYWQSLADLEEDPEVLAAVRRKEFPEGNTLWQVAGAEEEGPEGASRRDFLKVMGFSITAATLAACTRIPERKAMPLVSQPEELVPGRASYYATTCAGCAAGCGLLVKNRDGRPIKIEGNGDSTLTRGGTCAVGQATVLSLYDDARLRGPLWQGKPASWPEIDAAVSERLAAIAGRGGRVVLLTGTVSSPSTRALYGEWLARHPGARQVSYEPVSLAALRTANEQSFGRAVVPHYHLEQARVIVGIEADFLGTWLAPVELTRQYVSRRKLARTAAGAGAAGEAGHAAEPAQPSEPAERAEKVAAQTAGATTADAAPPPMSRHIQVESHLSLTGANADRRVSIRPSQAGFWALELLARVAGHAGSPPPALPQDLRAAAAAGGGFDPALLDQTASELWQNRGRSAVLCGVNDVAVQRVVNRINSLLGNVGGAGAPVDLAHPSLQSQGDDTEMARLVEEMNRGEIQAILLHGVNPAYDYPAAGRFVAGLGQVPLKVSFADRLDETAALADAVCPDHHFLEAWNDAEPVSGSYSLAQPLIAPLFDTRAVQESLGHWSGGEGQRTSAYDSLREFWRRELFPRLPDKQRFKNFDDFWDHTLQAGVLELPAEPPKAAGLLGAASNEAGLSGAASNEAGLSGAASNEAAWSGAAPSKAALPAAADRGDLAAAVAAVCDDTRRALAVRDGYEVRLHEKISQRDGRHANNPWLQELPDPITKLTWTNYASLPPRLAAELGLQEGDVVALVRDSVRVELPVQIQPGMPARTIAVALGYGRTAAGKVGNGVGANAFPLLGLHEGMIRGYTTGVKVEKTGRHELLAATQTHHSMEGRPIVRETTLTEYRQRPESGNEEHQRFQTLWAEHRKEGHFWGLAVDLNACTGCAACVVACQAENNVAVVGRDEVRRGREMHWIRVDRYYSGPAEAPATVFQPMMCQHCDNAPCETVCPVLATVHSSDGLNQQVYNRCVGTRYCANNCPYKVRRFNWFNYAENPRFPYHMDSDLGRMVLNPDIVVRSRGVMEKCSMCTHRIQEGKLNAKTRGSALRDGEIQTACQQACPADALVFGDRHDPASQIAAIQQDARFYHVLEELNTRPAVGYLTKVRNVEKG